MTGNNPTDRSKLGTKRHILTDKKGIPLSASHIISKTHDIKAVTDVIDNASYQTTFWIILTKKKRKIMQSSMS